MITVDLRSRTPIYEQLYEGIRTLILNGDIPADEKIPSVRELASELTINPNTIQKAYRQLEQDAYIYSVRGRGNFVNNIDLATKKREQKMVVDKLEDVLREAKMVALTQKKIVELVDAIYKEE